MCHQDWIVIEGETGTLYCPQSLRYVMEPVNLRVLLQNISNRLQLPANPNRARILLGDQHFPLLDTILNANQNINHPQTQFTGGPNIYPGYNLMGGGGYLGLTHGGEASDQGRGINSRIEEHPELQGLPGEGEDIGPANLVRDASHASSNMYSNYGTSNNQSYAPSQQGSLDNFSGHASPGALPFSNPSRPNTLMQYTTQQPPTGHENAIPYGGRLNDDQRADGYPTSSNFIHGMQYTDINSVPRLDRNPPTPLAVQPLPIGGGMVDGSGIPYLPEDGHQPGFNTQVVGTLENHIPDGNDADTGYVAQPDLTGLTGTNQVTDVAYTAVIEDDQLVPLPITKQESPHPPRQALSKPSRGDGLNTIRYRQSEGNANANGISKRPRAGRKPRGVAGLLTKIMERFAREPKEQQKNKKEKFTTQESKDQYTKNRRIGNCLLCKRGACKRACNYFGDDHVCDVCEKTHGKQSAAELCFQYHLAELMFCDFEHWRPACESIGVPLQPWPENLETLSMCFAVGPIGSRRVSRIAVDVDPQNAVVFNNGQLGNFINQLGIGLTVNQGLNDQEASISKLGTQLKTDETAQIAFVNEARFHVGLYFLIERYSDMIYHAKPEELKLGRHLIHGFLRSLVHEFSARTKALIERSHNWLKESKSARGRANAVVIVLAVMYGLCARQSNLNHRGYLDIPMSSLREQAKRAIPYLLKFGKVAYWLMNGELKNKAPPGDFESFTQTVLAGLATHLNTEIHVTHEFIHSNLAQSFSLDWTDGSNTMSVPFGRLLDYRGNFRDPDELLQFILSEPSADETSFSSPVPQSISAFLSNTEDPPFLVEKEPSPAVTHAGTHLTPIDGNGDGEGDEATPRLREDKGKGRAHDDINDGVGDSEILDELLRLEAEELEATLQASLTTETSHWDSNFGGPSRPSDSSGMPSQQYYPY